MFDGSEHGKAKIYIENFGIFQCPNVFQKSHPPRRFSFKKSFGGVDKHLFSEFSTALHFFLVFFTLPNRLNFDVLRA